MKLIIPGWWYQPGPMILAMAGLDSRPFSPGWFHEPRLKVANERGLKGLWLEKGMEPGALVPIYKATRTYTLKY
jgi:hypothetical protein